MRKYGPVINEVFLPAFEAMSPDHPLYSARNECINELQRAYKEQYIEATEV